MQQGSNSPLLILYGVFLYFPNRLIYFNDSDVLFQGLSLLILILCSFYGLVQNKVKTQDFWIIVSFMVFMIMPIIFNFKDLIYSENGVSDSLTQFLRISVYVLTVRFVDLQLSISKIEIQKLAISVIRITVYGQIFSLMLCAFISSSVIEYLYVTKTIASESGINILKFDGTLGNPNYLGYLLCMIVFLIYKLGYLFSKSERIIIILLTILLVLVSGSRTSFIVMAINFVLFKPILFIFTIIASIPFIEYIAQINLRLYEFYEAVSNYGNVVSFDERIELVQQGTLYFSQRPFFGHGYRPIEITDNFYITHLMRYGLIGTVGHSLIILWIVLTKIKKPQNIFVYIISITLFSYTGAYIDNFVLFFSTILFIMIFIKLNNN